ncbi:MAG: M55 family metallopeptidase [Thermaerobacterales bacterium]
MKVSISTDMEGISGLVDLSQINPLGLDYHRGRQLMTQDINAAIRGAFRAGATEVVVAGGHGANGARNVLDEDLHPDARLRSGKSRKYRLQNVDESFDAALQIGYHSRQGTGGVIDHTITSRAVYEIRINGRPIGEIGLNGLAAGWHGVPVALVSGDDVLAGETKEWFPWAEAVVVKKTVSRHAAICMHPTRAQALIEERTAAALNRLPDMKPLQLEAPYTAELQYRLTSYADMAEDPAGVTRVDGTTVSYTTDNIPDLLRTINMCIKLAGVGQPD